MHEDLKSVHRYLCSGRSAALWKLNGAGEHAAERESLAWPT